MPMVHGDHLGDQASTDNKDLRDIQDPRVCLEDMVHGEIQALQALWVQEELLVTEALQDQQEQLVQLVEKITSLSGEYHDKPEDVQVPKVGQEEPERPARWVILVGLVRVVFRDKLATLEYLANLDNMAHQVLQCLDYKVLEVCVD